MQSIGNASQILRRGYESKFGAVIGAFALLVYATLAASASAQTLSLGTADAACERCHKQIFDDYKKTPMANASGNAIDQVRAGIRKDPGTGVSYSISSEGRNVLLKFQQSDQDISGTRTLDYFLGSGHLGTTYLYSLNGYLLESPVAYYASTGQLDMKPGIATAHQVAPALPVRAACLRCHMSAVQHSDQGSFNHYTGAPFLHAAITCEACHGSTSQHVASSGRSPVINPAKLDEIRRDSICISCHLEGDVSVEKPHRTVLDYQPGDSISDYLSYFVYTGKDARRRGVSEVEQFSLSVCKRVSGPAMSCTSCHDPHSSPRPEKRVAFYRSKCLACHSNNGFAASHHPEKDDCTSCHMPRTGAENIPHVAWTDHRILREPQSMPLNNSVGTSNELVATSSPNATARDLALAYYNASFNGRPDLQAKALELFVAHRGELDNDTEALDALGTMNAGKGDFAGARAVLEKVLAVEPKDFTAATNLGTLLAKSGDLKGAIGSWQPAFERNQDIPGLAENLAMAQCLQGDVAGSRKTLETVLIYSPGIERVRKALALLPSCGSSKK